MRDALEKADSGVDLRFLSGFLLSRGRDAMLFDVGDEEQGPAEMLVPTAVE